MKSYIAIIVTSFVTCDSKCKHHGIARVIMTMDFQSEAFEIALLFAFPKIELTDFFDIL